MSQRKISDSPRIHANVKKIHPYLEASLCACPKASMTVEAAVVIPLITGFFLLLLFFFRILEIQATVEEALIYTGRKVAVESTLIDSEEALFLSAEAYFRWALKENSNGLIEDYVDRGSLGISLLGSEFTGEEITLKANYRVSLPVDFFGLEGIPLYTKNQFRKWIGAIAQKESQEEWVYITTWGSAYHSHVDCRSLDLSIQKTDIDSIKNLRGKNGQRYYGCGVCLKDMENEVVYYTNYGTSYHGNKGCSSLKRSIQKVPISQVGERHPCGFCY